MSSPLIRYSLVCSKRLNKTFLRIKAAFDRNLLASVFTYPSAKTHKEDRWFSVGRDWIFFPIRMRSCCGIVHLETIDWNVLLYESKANVIDIFQFFKLMSQRKLILYWTLRFDSYFICINVQLINWQQGKEEKCRNNELYEIENNIWCNCFIISLTKI